MKPPQAAPLWLTTTILRIRQSGWTDEEVVATAMLLGAPEPRHHGTSSFTEYAIYLDAEKERARDDYVSGYESVRLFGPTIAVVCFRWIERYYPDLIPKAAPTPSPREGAA